jgi:serine/threonine protein kinase
MYLLLLLFIKYLKYKSNTFSTFIKNEDLDQNKNPKQRYSELKFIEGGGFGNVYISYDNVLKIEVIIKRIEKAKVDQERFNREIMAIKNIKCQNSVEYYNHYDDDEYYYIVMEKCDEDLEKYIQEKGAISESMIKEILTQLNKAFKIMRSNGIIHRDLKPQNILLNKNPFTIKLADFGNSRLFNKKNFSTNIGTPGYAAPEQSNQNYDPTKCDLWSIGVIIYKLKFNEVPLTFYGGDIPGKFYNQQLDDLVRKLIVCDPNKRIGWDEYFNHPLFKN